MAALTLDSSSPHHLNADRPMSKLDRLRWLLLNRVNNARALDELDPALDIRRFRAASWMSLWSKIPPTHSPARRLCDLFWYSLPWTRLAGELRGKVNVLEIGCGTGRYGVLLRDCLGSAFGGYVGIDAVYHKEWEDYRNDPQIRLQLADSGETRAYLQGANLIFTQSAIEHFDEDLGFFRLLSEHVAATDHPIVQVHLMPSAGCLSTFLWHGVRHYTPRTTSRLTTLFDSRTTRALYSLGSAHCNRLHRKYITYPLLLGKGDRRHLENAEYDRALRQAVQRDDGARLNDEASFLALVMQTGLSADIFSAP